MTSALADPFESTEVKFKPQSVKGNRALALAYIDCRVIQDRLDDVLGVENWMDEYQLLPDGSVVCKLQLNIGGNWITKMDVGSMSEQPDGGDRLKAAFSDALKRAAVKFGIGRYLYRLPPVWADYDPVRKQFSQLPQLPTFARPKAKTAVDTEVAPAAVVVKPVPPAKPVAAVKVPATGAELHERLRKYETDLVKKAVCRVGELAHLRHPGRGRKGLRGGHHRCGPGRPSSSPPGRSKSSRTGPPGTSRRRRPAAVGRKPGRRIFIGPGRASFRPAGRSRAESPPRNRPGHPVRLSAPPLSPPSRPPSRFVARPRVGPGGWSVKNDTQQTILVEEKVEGLFGRRSGRVIRMLPGEVHKEYKSRAGCKPVEVYNAAVSVTKPVALGTITWQAADETWVVSITADPKAEDRQVGHRAAPAAGPRRRQGGRRPGRGQAERTRQSRSGQARRAEG